MASGTAKMFGCPFCGFRINPSDDVCSRCGNRFIESTRFECPFCGELVERGAKACPVCHVNYTEFRERAEARGGDDSIDSLLTEIIRLEAASVKKEDKKLSCPECSWLLDGSEEKCPKCGHSFAEDVSYQCPVCGSEIRADSDKCPSCGAMFTQEGATEEEIASEHEEASSALDEILTHADKESKSAVESDENMAMKQAVPEEAPEPKPESAELQSKTEAAPDEQMDAGTSEPGQRERTVSPQETTSQPKKTRTRKLKAKPKND